MAIRGSIEDAGLPNVFQVLALGGKTGRVAVERGTVHGAIYLEAGVVVWAEIVSAGDRLGDHLVRSGKITREQLRNAIESLTRDSQQTLAAALLDAGALARGELDRFVQHQVEEAVYLMFSWTKGQFTFTPNAPPPRHAVRVNLPADRLLLEAGRRADEWTVIQIAIPSFDRVYRRTAPRPGAAAPGDLSSEQHRILPLLDGTRDVNGLIELSGLSAFEVGKALLDLITSQVVQLQDRSSSARHFDEADLRAYALRAGEFADPERRKDAARHIADCALCGVRLRELHARRTREVPATPAAEGTKGTQRPELTTETEGTAAAATGPAGIAPPVGYRVTEAQPESPAPPAAKPTAAAPPATPPPAPPRRSTDLVWLMSPEEAGRMTSERRLARRAEEAEARARSTAAAKAAEPEPATPAALAATPPAAAPPPSQPPVKPVATIIAAPTAPMTRPAPAIVAAPAEPTRIRRPVPRRALAVAAAGAVIVAGGYLGVHAGRGAPARRAETRLASGAAPAVSPTPSAPPPTTASPPPTIASPPPAVVAARPIAAAPVTDAMSAPAAAPATTLPPRRTAAERDSAALPTGPDAELAAGGWRPIDRAEAIAILGGRMGAIPGLRIESITTSEARGRSRVRLAQIARSGQRIVLIETAGSEVPSGGAARATAVSVMPPPDPSSESIGSASLGNLQITARSSLAPEALRSLLGRLGVLSQP